MINFIVVEDNSINRKTINDAIVSKMMKNDIEFNIIFFDDINSKLDEYISKNKEGNIYILDLELPSGDGIDIARKIRNTYNNWISPIIIITAHSSLYNMVYKQRLQILDFIDKSDDVNSNLSETIDICLKMFQKENIYRFIYKNIENTIPFSQIDYIQRDGRKTKIITNDNFYYQNLSVNEMKKFFPSYFVISTKGVLVNVKNINKIDWNDCRIYFKDGRSEYIASKCHKKELTEYEIL